MDSLKRWTTGLNAKVDTVTSTTDTLEIFGKAPSGFDGRYVARWRREPDGEWKLSRLMMQPAPSATHESP